MKQNTRKLFSLLLALVMALSLAVPAFAAEGDPPEKELRFAWLMNDGNGFYVEDFVLNSKDNPFEGGLGMSPVGERFAIFFIWNNKTNQRENFVVPKGDGNITVTKLAKDEIASGAKQTQYYVKLRMNEFKDGEVTANGLSFHVNAMLDDFGFYSAATPSVETALESEIEAAKLTGNALYFCTPYAGEEGRDTVTKVEKDPNLPDHAKCYDIEQVKDGLWKITINDAGKIMLKNGGIAVNLNFEVKQSDGNTRQDGRSIFIKGEEQAPTLWWAHPDWNDDGSVTYNPENIHNGTITSWPAGSQYGIVVGTCDVNENGPDTKTFKPIEPSKLTASKGLNLNTDVNYKKGDKYGKYYFTAEVDAWDQDYTITYGEYSIKVSSKPTDIDIYKTPEALAANKAGIWGAAFHPAYRDDPYYIVSTATDAEYGRHLTDAKLTADWEDNKLVDLEKVSDNVYKLTIKKDADLNREAFLVKLDLSWADFMGNTWTDTGSDFEFKSVDGNSILASSTALTDGAKTEPEILEYSAVGDKVSTKLTLNAGEKKDVYLYASRFFGRDGAEPSWKVWPIAQHKMYHSSDKALTIAGDEKDFSKFTLTATKPGTYEIWIGGENWDYENMKLYHADGKEYTAAEYQKFQEAVPFYANNDGKFYVIVDDQEVPFEEAYPGEKYELKSLGIRDFGWQHLTVTVTGEAKTFTDVKPTDWFAAAVQYACGRGLMNGTDKGFEPVREVYNTEMLQILWNMSGNAKVDTAVSAAAGQWYAGAVNWAASVKLIDGGAFTGQKLITRGEVRELMAAYGKLVGKDYSNLFNGNESGDLMLDKTLTRCELAQMLTNAKA